MKKRQLSPSFVNELLSGKYQHILALVQQDDTLDLEMRGESIIVYYRGGKLFQLYQDGKLIPLDLQYGCTTAPASIDTLLRYCQEAKSLIDQYQTNTKRNLGEKEISQRMVMENNYSPYAPDTDYYIIDMEFNDGYQFDLVALKWASTSSARRTGKCSLALIETKQGISTLRSSRTNPGIRQHFEDYKHFTLSPEIATFREDMLEVFRQKCKLGLIEGIKNKENINLQLSNEIEFIVVLANLKPASDNLINELNEMRQDKQCKFALASFMGYGLYSKCILDYTQLLARLEHYGNKNS